MNALAATVAMYRKVGVRAAELAWRNWTVLLSVFVYLALIAAASAVLAFTAMPGPFWALGSGLIVTLLGSACIASFLYLVEMIVRTSRVNVADFRRSFTVYLSDVVGVGFVLWLFFRFVGPLVVTLPQGGVIMFGVEIALIVFLNAVPELIYLGHHSTLALLGESYRFIAENWLEWFPPNFVLLGFLLLLRQPETEGVAWVLQTALVTLAAYFSMIVRGLLFIELSGSTRRGRLFRYRMGQ